jgi:putative pyruvate formate lyase activating enzyme
MYCTLETMQLLNGVIDFYLTDFKFGNDECASQLCKSPRYTGIIKRNHLIAYQQGEVLIRHLVLPDHINCCSYPIIEFLSKSIPDVWVNIMDQYRPMYKVNRYPLIARTVTYEEIQNVISYAKKLGLHVL